MPREDDHILRLGGLRSSWKSLGELLAGLEVASGGLGGVLKGLWDGWGLFGGEAAADCALRD